MSAVSPAPAPDRTLAAAGFATTLALVAFTLPLGLVTAIGPDLGATVAGRTWIISSMSVGFAGALLVAGSIADDVGRRRIFLAGLITFAVGAFAAAASPSVFTLAASRVIQGVGGAALLATALALIAQAFPAGPTRAHATSIWGAMIGLGIAVGPIAGVLVAELGSWRTSYAVLGVVALLSIVPCGGALSESRAATPRPLDLPGAALLALGLLAITAGIVQGNASGWGAPLVWVFLLGGIVVITGFAVYELQTEQPLFDITLLRSAPFTAALTSSFILGLTVIAFMSYVMTFAQTTLNARPVAAMLWCAPWATVTFLVAIKGRALAGVMSARIQIASGLLICGLGLLTMLGLSGGDSPAHLLPGLVIMGVGTGFLNAALGQAAVATVPPERSGMGAGANNTARYLGAALGVALVVGTLHAGTQNRIESALAPVLEPGIAVPLAHQIASGQPLTSASGFQPDALALVGRLGDAASADAMNTVIRSTAVLTLAGSVLCLVLMRPRQSAVLRDDVAEVVRQAPPPMPIDAPAASSVGPATAPTSQPAAARAAAPEPVGPGAEGGAPSDGRGRPDDWFGDDGPTDSLWLRPR